MCATDCGRCIDCIETDDYAPTWRNPRFQEAATSTLGGHAGTETPREPENVHAPALTVPGFTEALRALGRDGGESDDRCTSDVTHRDEEDRVSRCALPAGHAPLTHDDGEGCQWTDGFGHER